MEPKPVKPILFLNSPVEDIDADIIGMEPYVEQLNAAIDAGAQVIAVTSPFGAGKALASSRSTALLNNAKESNYPCLRSLKFSPHWVLQFCIRIHFCRTQ